jgi:hypothetical protein
VPVLAENNGRVVTAVAHVAMRQLLFGDLVCGCMSVCCVLCWAYNQTNINRQPELLRETVFSATATTVRASAAREGCFCLTSGTAVKLTWLLLWPW